MSFPAGKIVALLHNDFTGIDRMLFVWPLPDSEPEAGSAEGASTHEVLERAPRAMLV
jgi:hypothetical protein